MDRRTQELTYGAMLVAVFGVLLIFNRQTGALFEEFIIFVLPIPMAVFSLRYGWKDSLPVLVCMVLISLFLGTFYTIFYAAGEAVIGMFLGERLREKRDLKETQLVIIVLSALLSVMGSVVLASLSGINVTAEVSELQNTMQKMVASYGMSGSGLEAMFSFSSMLRLYIISMILFGVMQGFLVFRISLLIMRRLRLPVPLPGAIGIHRPPRWTGYAAALLMLAYMASAAHPLSPEWLQHTVQTAGLCASLFLLWYGWLGLSMLLRRWLPGPKLLVIAAAFLCFLIMPYAVLLLGFLFISTNLLMNLPET